MWPFAVPEESEASVSPPAALTARHQTPSSTNNTFGLFNAAAAATTTSDAVVHVHLDRPHTSAASKQMLQQPFAFDVQYQQQQEQQQSSSPLSRGRRSRRHSSSAGSLQDGIEAATMPITAGIRPTTNCNFLSSAPPLITEDTFAVTLPKLPGASSTSSTTFTPGASENAATAGGNGNGSGDNRNGSHDYSSASSAGGRPLSQTHPVSSPSPAMMSLPNNNIGHANGVHYGSDGHPYGAAGTSSFGNGGGGVAQGRLPEVPSTLRGVATSGHPPVPRNMPHTNKGRNGGTNPTPSSVLNGVGGGGGYGPYNNVGGGAVYPSMARQGSMQTYNGVAGISAGSYMSAPYPYMMPGVMNHNAGAPPPFGAFHNNGSAASNSSMNMLFGVAPPYPSGYPNALPSVSSFRPGSMMGISAQDSAAQMHYRNMVAAGQGAGAGGNNYSNNNNSKSNGVQYPNTNFSSGAGRLSSMSPPRVSDPLNSMQPRTDYQGGGGSALYDVQRGGGYASAPRAHSGPSSGQSAEPSRAGSQPTQRSLQAAGTAPSFYSPNSPVRQQPQRQHSMVSFLSRSSSRRGRDTDVDLFMQSITTDVQSIADVRPVSQKAKRPNRSLKKQKEPSTAPSDWLASPLAEKQKSVAAFSAEESVSHERRSTSWGVLSGSQDIPRLASQRLNSTRVVGQHRVSGQDPADSRCESRRGLLRRFANECGRLGRGAASGLRRRSSTNGEKRRRKRKGKAEEARSPSSASGGSFFDDDSSDEKERSFDSSSSSSDDDGEEQWSERSTPDLKNDQPLRESSRGQNESVSVASTIAQRRRVRVKSLDAGVITLAVQERK